MFSKKLNLILEKLGYKDIQQKADACGVHYDAMRHALKGKPFSDDRIAEVGKKLGLSEVEITELILLKTQDQAKKPETKSILDRVLGSDFNKNSAKEVLPQNLPDNVTVLPREFKIPVYSSIKGGDGEMGITDGSVDGHIYVNEDYIKQKVFCLKVSGDSMKDKLFDGEIAIFKPVNGDPVNDSGIYAIEIEGWASWVVKKIKRDPSGIVQLISTNPAYPVREIDPETSNVIVRGKLIESRRLF